MRRLSRDFDLLYRAKNLESRIEKHSIPEPNSGCTIWTGAIATGGYGQIRFGKETWAIHRVVYFLNYGPFDRQLCVCHRCDNPSCINPSHLFLGTDADNNADMLNKGRGVVLRGEEHSRVLLKDSDIIEIFRLRSTGLKQSELAARFNVNVATIAGVLSRINWKHIHVDQSLIEAHKKYRNRRGVFKSIKRLKQTC